MSALLHAAAAAAATAAPPATSRQCSHVEVATCTCAEVAAWAAWTAVERICTRSLISGILLLLLLLR